MPTLLNHREMILGDNASKGSFGNVSHYHTLSSISISFCPLSEHIGVLEYDGPSTASSILSNIISDLYGL